MGIPAEGEQLPKTVARTHKPSPISLNVAQEFLLSQALAFLAVTNGEVGGET